MVTADSAYWSDGIVTSFEAVMNHHRALGGDFPEARPALLANLRTLQEALPLAIAEVEAAMEESDA